MRPLTSTGPGYTDTISLGASPANATFVSANQNLCDGDRWFWQASQGLQAQATAIIGLAPNQEEKLEAVATFKFLSTSGIYTSFELYMCPASLDQM